MGTKTSTIVFCTKNNLIMPTTKLFFRNNLISEKLKTVNFPKLFSVDEINIEIPKQLYIGSENFQKIMLLHPRNRYGTYSEHCRTLPTASNIKKKRDSIIVIHRSWNQYKAQEQCVPYFPKKRLFWYVSVSKFKTGISIKKKSISLLLLQTDIKTGIFSCA